MKELNQYIIERLKLNKNDKAIIKPNYKPKTSKQLRKLLKKLLKERGPNADLNDIDVSNIDDMSPEIISKGAGMSIIGLFDELDPHNIDISKWDVSNVENMDRMFANCENFDCDLSLWNVKKVKDMQYMFANCESFAGVGLDDWKVSEDCYTEGTFLNCDLVRKNPPSFYRYSGAIWTDEDMGW